MLEKALEILKKIESLGFKAYIIGGFSRNYYMGQESADIDICTSANPKELKEIFQDLMLPEINYGSVIVMYKNIRFEITTFREDSEYEDNRKPSSIKYIDSLSDDLKRRDFIMNTLCINSDGEFVDLLDAMYDIDNRIVRTVGNPKYTIKQDVLRILRAIRFAAILDFNLDEGLKEYIIKYGYLLKKLSADRKKAELDKIFLSKDSKRGIDLILELELDKFLDIPNIKDVVIISEPIGIWAQLNVEKNYNFSNDDLNTMEKIRELSENFNLENKTIYKYGAYIINIVSEIKNIDKSLVTEKWMNLPIHSREEIDISGTDICEILNIKPSKVLNGIFEDVIDKILLMELKNEKKEILNYIKMTYSNY